jgi:hypothetical protein
MPSWPSSGALLERGLPVAIGETAKLIAALELQDKLSGPLKKAGGNLAGVESRLSKIGGIARQGIGTAAANIAKLGVVAGGALALGVHQGLESLAQLESGISAVDGALENAGLQGQLTGKQVAQWANEIEAATGAAFDDKDIVQATSGLIRYGHVAPGSLRPAMQVMTDLAAKTGDVGSAGELMAKALAAPEKAAGKLARVGVILTSEQQAQIKAMVEAGDTAGAQALLLDQLAKATRGAAQASQGPYQRALSTLKDTFEDVERALAIGFLPVLEKISEKLKGKLADPAFLSRVEEFGRTLAGSLDKAFGLVEKLPWAQIGDAMKLAGQGAKAALDLFTGMPPWVQTAVLTGWGLNKLTGGALGGIVSELGKGLIKGVLGMNAAVVNLTAATVNAPGLGAGGAGGAAAAGAGRFAGLAGVLRMLGGGALIAGGLAAQSGALGAGPNVAGVDTMKIAGPLATIAGAFVIGGPVLGALAAVAEAVHAGFEFMGQRDSAQADLQAKADAAAQQTSSEALANLQKLTGTLGNQGMWESLVTNTFGAAQTQDGLINLAAAITENGKLSSSEQVQALQALQDAQGVAIQRGWSDAAAAIGLRIEEIKRGEQGSVTVNGPVQTTPTGDTPVVPGPGFTEWMHGQQAGLDELAQQQATGRQAFVEAWSGIREKLGLVGQQGAEVRRAIAKGLGLTVDELVSLRHVARSEIAATLGVSVQEFIKARRQAHGDDAVLAAKLGISVEELQAIREKARATAANTSQIVDKNWSPTINVPVSVHSSFGVSGRTVATAVERFWDRSRPRVV